MPQLYRSENRPEGYKVILIVGEAPAPTGDGTPFTGRSGRRLGAILGAPVRDLFDCANLLEYQARGDKGHRFNHSAAQKAAYELMKESDHRWIVMCGRRVARAFGFGSITILSWHHLPPRSWLCIPHPSPLNGWWEDPDNRMKARTVLLDALK